MLDLGLPDADGLALLDDVRADPARRDLPVAVFTGRELSPDVRRHLGERAAAVLRKGNGVPILDAVERAIAGGRATEAAD